MARRTSIASMEFYRDNSTLKWVILGVSTIISIGSVYYSNIFFVSEEIVNKNNSIPTILLGGSNEFIDYNNLDIDSSWSLKMKNETLLRELAEMKRAYPPIEILLKDPTTQEVFGKQFVYYKNSFLLTQLIAYPYIQLSVIAIFGFISYLAFNYSKTAEQNRVWVGLAKETAHQLGTPLSSLLAWIEVLREDPEMRDKGVIDELEKDIHKLKIVTERFSSIGSTPALRKENVVLL